MRYDAVFLDAGGVFLLPDHATVLPSFERARVEVAADVLDRCHYAAVTAWDAHEEVDDAAWRTFWRAYCGAAGVAQTEVERVAAVLHDAWDAVEWSRVITDAVEALRDLASLGVRLAVVSNSDGKVESLLREAAVCQVGPGDGVRVTTVIDSSVVGVFKPDPGIFDLALRATRTTPDRALHVGDSLRADVRGALGAGLDAVHLDPFGFCSTDDHPHARTLRDVVDLVES